MQLPLGWRQLDNTETLKAEDRYTTNPASFGSEYTDPSGWTKVDAGIGRVVNEWPSCLFVRFLRHDITLADGWEMAPENHIITKEDYIACSWSNLVIGKVYDPSLFKDGWQACLGVVGLPTGKYIVARKVQKK